MKALTIKKEKLLKLIKLKKRKNTKSKQKSKPIIKINQKQTNTMIKKSKVK